MIDRTGYTVGIWDVTYYLVDEDGNDYEDDNGNVVLFNDNGDVCHAAWAEDVDIDALVENDDCNDKTTDLCGDDMSRHDGCAIDEIVHAVLTDRGVCCDSFSWKIKVEYNDCTDCDDCDDCNG
jgi:hypothetical protein